jgi:hypothetical protein
MGWAARERRFATVASARRFATGEHTLHDRPAGKIVAAMKA